ncbi:MAG: M15 family metallopeptidase [Rectinemataceae bacterium]
MIASSDGGCPGPWPRRPGLAFIALLVPVICAGAAPAASVPAATPAASVAAVTATADPRLAPALEALVRATPSLGPAVAASIRGRIEADPKGFLALLDTVLAERASDPWRFVRADKVAPPLPSGFEPSDLVALDGKKVAIAKDGLKLRRQALAALLAMASAARTEGLKLVAGSAYRSWAYQKTVFAREVAAYGEAQARRESAEPGRSQHQLGTVVDFSPIDEAFALRPEFAWLSARAGGFGFSRSYPEGLEAVTGYRSESWHWRWIGTGAASLQKAYFGDVQQYLMLFLSCR